MTHPGTGLITFVDAHINQAWIMLHVYIHMHVLIHACMHSYTSSTRTYTLTRSLGDSHRPIFEASPAYGRRSELCDMRPSHIHAQTRVRYDQPISDLITFNNAHNMLYVCMIVLYICIWHCTCIRQFYMHKQCTCMPSLWATLSAPCRRESRHVHLLDDLIWEMHYWSIQIGQIWSALQLIAACISKARLIYAHIYNCTHVYICT